jgi:hypothetical protein
MPPQVTKVDAGADAICGSTSSRPHGRLQLNDYAERYLVDRCRGAGRRHACVGQGGGRYAMRIWLDREALAARGLTVTDVAARCGARTWSCRPGASSRRSATSRCASTRSLPPRRTSATWCSGEGPRRHLVRLGEVADGRARRRGPCAICSAATACRRSASASSSLHRQRTLEVAQAVRAEVVRTGNLSLPGHRSTGQTSTPRCSSSSRSRGLTVTLSIACPGDGRDLPVPRYVARHADPGGHDPGVDHRHLHRPVCFGYSINLLTLLGAGARDRPGGRRRHRGAGERQRRIEPANRR